jgi:hypothetical protein
MQNEEADSILHSSRGLTVSLLMLDGLVDDGSFRQAGKPGSALSND